MIFEQNICVLNSKLTRRLKLLQAYFLCFVYNIQNTRTDTFFTQLGNICKTMYISLHNARIRIWVFFAYKSKPGNNKACMTHVLDSRLVYFLSSYKMNQLIADFEAAIKILIWRDPKTRQYNDPIFLIGLRHSSVSVREKKIREILESVDSKHLVYLSNLYFVKADRVFSKLLFGVLSHQASALSEALNKMKKKFDGK